jgi:hypothetical protein
MTNQHNLPDKDDAPWLNHAGLSSQEIEELRKQKFEISRYAKQKFKEKMTEPNPDINFELNENGEIAKIIINSSGSGWDEIFEKINEYARNLPIPKKKLMNNSYIPDDDALEEMLQVKLTEEKKEELERLRRKEQEKDTDK